MWNIFKKRNMVIEQLAKTNAELEKKLIERNNENTTLNRKIQTMTEDRDYWKSQYEHLTENFDPNSAKLGEEIKKWAAQKMLKNIQDFLQVENLKKRVDNATPEEVTNIFEKITTVKIENIFLHELGEIIKETILD